MHSQVLQRAAAVHRNEGSTVHFLPSQTYPRQNRTDRPPESFGGSDNEDAAVHTMPRHTFPLKQARPENRRIPAREVAAYFSTTIFVIPRRARSTIFFPAILSSTRVICTLLIPVSRMRSLWYIDPSRFFRRL